MKIICWTLSNFQINDFDFVGFFGIINTYFSKKYWISISQYCEYFRLIFIVCPKFNRPLLMMFSTQMQVSHWYFQIEKFRIRGYLSNEDKFSNIQYYSRILINVLTFIIVLTFTNAFTLTNALTLFEI